MSAADLQKAADPRIWFEDPEWDQAAEGSMEFRLTYEGPLWGAHSGKTRADHKHEVRQVFHKQLRKFWDLHPNLKEWRGGGNVPASLRGPLRRDTWGDVFERGNGYKFVPLVTKDTAVFCGLDILFLRPGFPGAAISGGDLDNRVKTLFDALRVPTNTQEMGAKCEPASADETPFFCLLEDDSLVSRLSITTDLLLQPTSPAMEMNPNDARLVIQISIRNVISGWNTFGN